MNAADPDKRIVCVFPFFLFSLIIVYGVLFDDVFLGQVIDPFFILLTRHSISGRSQAIQWLVRSALVVILLLGSYLITRLFQKENKAVKISSILPLVAAFVPFVLIAFYMRPAMDDYSFLTAARDEKFWDMEIGFYKTWSGRYTGYPLYWLSNLIPWQWMIKLFPLVCMMMMLVSLAVILYNLLPMIVDSLDARPRRYWSLAVALMILLGILLCSSDLLTSLFWFAAGINYGFGAAISFCAFACLFWSFTHRNSPVSYGFSLLSVVLACGTNELTALSVSFLSVAGVFAWYFIGTKDIKKLRRLSGFSLCALLFTVISFVAPGNWNRFDLIKTPTNDPLMVKLIYDYLPEMIKVYSQFLLQLAGKFQFLLLSAAAFFILGTTVRFSAHGKTVLVWLVFVMQATSFVCFAANVSGFAPSRVHFIPVAWVVIAMAIAACAAGSAVAGDTELAHPRHASLAACGVLLLIGGTVFYYQHISAVRSFATEFDYRHAQLIQADPAQSPTQTCSVRTFHPDLVDLLEDSNFWVNLNIARFYQLDALSSPTPCADEMIP